MIAGLISASILLAAVHSQELSCLAGTRLLKESDAEVESSYCARPEVPCSERALRRLASLTGRDKHIRLYPEKTGAPNLLLFQTQERWGCWVPHGPSLRIVQGETEVEENFVNGVIEGAVITRKGGVKIEERNYKHGELDGLSTLWFDSGQKYSEETYRRGVRSGPFADWSDEGKLIAKGMWVPAGLDGLFTRWDPDGKKEFEFQFKEGRLAKVIRQPKWHSPLKVVIMHPDEEGVSDSCYGIAPKEIEEQQSKLAHGTTCAHGDFDGNGTEDVSINFRDSEYFAAVFMLGPGKILAHYRIPGTLGIYQADSKAGLVDLSQEEVDRIYLYNAETKQFDQLERPHEN